MITIGEVITIHNDLLSEWNGKEGILKPNELKSSIKSSLLGYYENDIDTISSITYNLCSSHPFNDGNKRTSVGVWLFLVQKNNIKVNISEKELEDLIMSIASEKMKKDEFLNIIKSKLQ